VWVWGFWFGFALRRVALLCGVFVRLHLALFPAGGPFLPSLSVNLYQDASLTLKLYLKTTTAGARAGSAACMLHKFIHAQATISFGLPLPGGVVNNSVQCCTRPKGCALLWRPQDCKNIRNRTHFTGQTMLTFVVGGWGWVFGYGDRLIKRGYPPWMASRRLQVALLANIYVRKHHDQVAI
jgi:hypothetical protein